MDKNTVFRLLVGVLALLLVACGGGGGDTPTNTTDPIDLTDPIDQTDPIDPIDPIDPTDPSNPTSTDWVTRARGTSSEFRDVAFSGDRYVAVGDSTMAVSDDGVHWTLKSGSGQAITWGNGLFVVVGEWGVIKTSPDGITWTTRQSGCGTFCSDDLLAITWSGTRFVAVGEAGMVYTSEDGITWTKRDAGVSSILTSVATSGSRFVMVGYDAGAPRYSDDGITWHVGTGTGTEGPTDVMWDGYRFIASGFSGIYQSADGMTWTYVSGDWIFDIVWDGSTYLGTNGGGGISKSADLDTWNSVFYSVNQFIARILPVAATGEYVGVGGEVAASGVIVTSTDLATWHVRLNGRELRGVVWDGSRFMAVDELGRFSVSNDGVEWDSTYAIPYDGGGVDLYFDLAWSDSLKRYVTVADDILWSDDGINWTVGQSATSATCQYMVVKWIGDQFVAVNNSGAFYTSADGKTWAYKGTIGSTSWIHDIAWSSSLNRFVAVSGGGEAFTSTDGTAWIPQTVEQYKSLYGATWTGNQFVVVGSSGRIFTSPDGANWTSQTSGTNYSLYAVSYNAGELLAVGYEGQVLRSTDGINWTKQTTPSGTGDLKAIAKSPTRTVAVGTLGTILSRP